MQCADFLSQAMQLVDGMVLCQVRERAEGLLAVGRLAGEGREYHLHRQPVLDGLQHLGQVRGEHGIIQRVILPGGQAASTEQAFEDGQRGSGGGRGTALAQRSRARRRSGARFGHGTVLVMWIDPNGSRPTLACRSS